jgi:hypothetical protein
MQLTQGQMGQGKTSVIPKYKWANGTTCNNNNHISGKLLEEVSKK